ncbi:MAG: hypothetical protein ABI193_21695 [Minicystis sp.]
MPSSRLLRRVAFAATLGAALGASTLAALADPPTRLTFAPDPPAHPARKQIVFDIAVRRGKASIEKTRSVMLPKPAETARTTGRFALELRIGNQLLDRLRFNVPMMGDEPPQRSKKRPFRAPSLDDVTTRVTAQIADHPRATYLLLIDRITGEEQRFDWPPEPDGRVLPWKTGRVADAGPGDFPDGSARILERKDTPDASLPDALPTTPSDAGQD